MLAGSGHSRRAMLQTGSWSVRSGSCCRRGFGVRRSIRRGVRRRDTVVRLSRESGEAHPVMAGCLNVSVGRRLELLALRAELLEAPVAFPVIPLSHEGCMLGRDAGYAELA